MIRPLLFLLLLASCTPTFEPTDDAAIRKVMSDQEAAWDRGDIDGFMTGYVDTICFVERIGKVCGRDAVTANYRKSFPDKAAMGDLEFENLELLPAGNDRAWMTGSWDLYRAADTLGGGFSLFWVKGEAGWRIARDHTY